MLATVRCPGEQRGQVTELVRIFEGKILAVGHDALTVSLDGHPSKVDDFEELLRPFGIASSSAPAAWPCPTPSRP
jgi:acetolactate synthase-1/3 small subunit